MTTLLLMWGIVCLLGIFITKYVFQWLKGNISVKEYLGIFLLWYFWPIALLLTIFVIFRVRRMSKSYVSGRV